MLAVLWDLETEEVEDILEEFVNKSLLFVDSHNKPFLYYLHDLQLDFLVEQNRTQLEVSLDATQQAKTVLFIFFAFSWLTHIHLCVCVCVFQSLHSKVVHQYQQHYKDAHSTSGDEECLYWIRFLTYHMAKANLFQVTHKHRCTAGIYNTLSSVSHSVPFPDQELYSLMFSLDWVSTKAQLMGPAYLINDYVEYGPILDKEVS